MDGLRIFEAPEQRLPTMIVAFAGWPDADEAATRAVRYLVDTLGAKKFAEIDPEEFYDFTVVRPQTRINRRGERRIKWPGNDFFYFAPKQESRGFILFIGTEPNLRWRAYSNIITSIAEQHGVQLVISLGALLDAVPHTREPKITGRASSPLLTNKVEWLGIRNSAYQGPTGIHTAFMDACDRKGLAQASIWGHCPHYVTTSPNPKVSHALLLRLRSLVDFDVDLEELQLAASTFETEVTKSISKEQDVSAYVEKLEQRFDTASEEQGDIPSPSDMVEELEQFLRRSHRDRQAGGDDA